MSVLRVIGLVIIIGLVTGFLLYCMEGDPPVVNSLPGPVYVSDAHVHEFRVRDSGTGVEKVSAWLEANGERFDLKTENYEGNFITGASIKFERSINVTLEAKTLGLGDGSYTLVVEAQDYSWRGNRGRAEVAIVVDSKPPQLSLLTGLTYVRRGGSELAVYTVSEDADTHGIQLGDLFFRGTPHPHQPQRQVVLYGYPPQTKVGILPVLVAVDRAGNQSSIPLSIEIIERAFPQDVIQLSDGFMNRKVAELVGQTDDDVVTAYVKINNDMRKENADRIRTICEKSSEEPLWDGAFLQLPNSHVGARFAESRTYRYNGQDVDHQTHLGYDLASTSNAPIPAANDGVVAFIDRLGIYGNAILIDHGLGLFTLYGHLSSFAVEKGQAVTRGDTIGTTGTTGLAGGDHLHYGMLVGGEFVDPLEWFDGRWIREHIDPKLAPPSESP